MVGVGELALSSAHGVQLVTYGLGSCLAVAIHDPQAQVGGVLHLMLPDSRLDPPRSLEKPAMFADTGLPMLFNAMFGLRAEFGRIRLFIAGGASVINGADPFRIGDRNLTAVKKFLQSCPCTVVAHDVGGTINRTVHLEVSTGTVSLKMPDSSRQIKLST